MLLGTGIVLLSGGKIAIIAQIGTWSGRRTAGSGAIVSSAASSICTDIGQIVNVLMLGSGRIGASMMVMMMGVLHSIG